jgi:hypothetical protein
LSKMHDTRKHLFLGFKFMTELRLCRAGDVCAIC